MDGTAKQNEKCIICGQEFEEKYQEYGNRQQVGEKGKKNLLHFAQLRCDDKILKILETETAILVHDKCRRNFTDKKKDLEASLHLMTLKKEVPQKNGED